MLQAPSRHAGVPAAASGQARPHAPQFATSLAKSKQLMPQGENGLLQTKLQLPSRQTPAPSWGALQVAPQPPQFWASDLVSTQTPLQAASWLAHSTSLDVLVGAVLSPWRTHCWEAGSHS